MGEDKIKKAEGPSQNIDEILRERERLDELIQQRFKKEVAILFTDICDYTAYMDKRGDISGRALLQKHNDMVLPAIGKHEGLVVKTIGDAVMASFSTALAAIRAAIDIQTRLHEHNLKADPAEKIRVKIGINVGTALLDGTDFYGDVVNTASRIQSQAKADEILISSAAYDQVSGSEDILCRWHGTVKVKGKSEPLELFRVIWREDDIALDVAPQVRAHEVTVEKKVRRPVQVLELDVAREGDRLKISAHEHLAGEESTIRHYERMPVSMDWIETRCQEIVETLNNANRKGQLTREVLSKLREIGQVFFDELLTHAIKQKLNETRAEYLNLNLDDHLVHIPWELLHDGRQFLCQRFNMGRLVRTQQTLPGIRTRSVSRPLKILVLADPEGDLKGAYMEGTQIRDLLDQHKGFVSAFLRTDNISNDFLKGKLRNFDFVHFAGHADYNPQNAEDSGWRLSEGTLKARDVIKMAGTATMPALIFSNACQSARTEEWTITESFQNEIFGLANAFLLAGVKHYIGTFWEILDEPSSRFALEFYKNLLAGRTTGEAVRMARETLIKEYGLETIVWASYLLYGDPTSNYLDQITLAEPKKEPAPREVVMPDAEVRAREEAVDLAGREAPKKKLIWWAAGAGILGLAALLLLGYPQISKRQIANYEKIALAHYNEGRFEEALNACNILQGKDPDAPLAHLIQGNIYLRQGKLDLAEAVYGKALQAKEGTASQKAEALGGLGRIASIRKQPEVALNYYQQATEAAPENGLGYLSQALILEGRGNYGKALDLLAKAQEAAPKDPVIAALTNETRKQATLATDRERQERIDRMVKELLETMKSPPRALPSDGWTSPPLSMWVMDFEAKGYGLQEGEERLLASGIVDQLLQHSRAQVVERALLDKLLQELKLGTSNLTDRSTALSLGKILAARLIVMGQVVYAGSQTQVSMRLIETETGRITSAVNESFGSAVPASVLVERLSKLLLEKLVKLYPIRGKISEVGDKDISLNIGQKAGVRVGQRFQVIDDDVTLEITSIDADTSLARIATGKSPLKKGLRVEGLSEG